MNISFHLDMSGSEVGMRPTLGLPAAHPETCWDSRRTRVPVSHLVPRGLSQQRLEPAQVPVEGEVPPVVPCDHLDLVGQELFVI